MTDTFDAIYYSGPTPSSAKSLTLLGLVFDHLYFPGVYIPKNGLDEKATIEELRRLESLEKKNLDHLQMLDTIVLALNAKHLDDFCIFTGESGIFGKLEPGTDELTKQFQELVFGPPPPGFSPIYHMGFNKGLPGDEKPQINGPSCLSYPPNALLYAARTGLIMVNDNPDLPIPAIGGTSLKSNAKMLSTIMAFESLRLVLPNIRPFGFQELAEFRHETKETVKPFRLAMLRLSRDLNAVILSDAKLSDVQKEAQFLAETVVLPELEDLRRNIIEPSKKWPRRLVEATKQLPELATNFATMPKGLATAKVLSVLASIFADVRDDQLEKEGQIKRGAYHYLLKIGDVQSQH